MAGESSKAFEFDYRYFNDDEVNDFINDHDYGWKTVTYKKKDKKQQKQGSSSGVVDANGDSGDSTDVFRSIELQAEERRKRLIQAEKRVVVFSENSGDLIENGDADEDNEKEKEKEVVAVNGGEETKTTKAKKPKKPKVTVSEAASKIDSADLDAFLAEITVSYETHEDIQLMRFADYFGRSFAIVSGSQSPLMKILMESSVSRMVDLPISHISDDVLKTSTTWLSSKSSEALGSFVMWSLDNIVSELHQKTSKGRKMVNTPTPAKSQVGLFVVLAMVLRHKPNVLMNLLPLLKENPKHQEQEKLYVAVWVITQACEGDMVVGLFMWVNFLLPMLCNGSIVNTQCKDLILQVVERIVTMPKARAILVNNAARKGERLVPPSALEALMRFTFPADSARSKETERFEAIYPILKEIALVAPIESKVIKQLAHQILPFALRATGEGIPELAIEGVDLFLWCLTMNPDCYHQWDNLYLENIEASVVILKKLPEEWKLLTLLHSHFDPLKITLMNFVLKNKEGLTSEVNADRKAALKDAQKQCKKLLSRVSRGNGCVKVSVLVTMVIAVSAAYVAFNQKSV